MCRDEFEDLETNKLAKVCEFSHGSNVFLKAFWLVQILCTVPFAVSALLTALNGFRGLRRIYTFWFLISFASIIPIRYVTSTRFDNLHSRLLQCSR